MVHVIECRLGFPRVTFKILEDDQKKSYKVGNRTREPGFFPTCTPSFGPINSQQPTIHTNRPSSKKTPWFNITPDYMHIWGYSWVKNRWPLLLSPVLTDYFSGSLIGWIGLTWFALLRSFTWTMYSRPWVVACKTFQTNFLPPFTVRLQKNRNL